MATFLRRKLGKVLEKDTIPAILTVPRAEGNVVLTKPELQRYTWLFAMVDRCAAAARAGGGCVARLGGRPLAPPVPRVLSAPTTPTDTTTRRGWVPPPTHSPHPCSDGDQAVGGAEGALFLRRSGLTNEQLREVWRLASGGVSKQKLELHDWLVACKLIAAVQHKRVEPNIASVIGMTPDLPV